MLKFLIIVYITAFFCCFQFIVNSSKAYTLLFILVLIDFWSLFIIESLSNQLKVCVLLFPMLNLLVLFLSASISIKGTISLLVYLYNVVDKHKYCFISFQNLLRIWGPLKNYLNSNMSFSLSSCFKLLFGVNILLICVLKELIKKYYVLILLFLFQTNTVICFAVYCSHLILFIVLVSLLGIDPKLVKFLSPFFGNYVLTWLGSYQILEDDKKKD